MSSEATIDLTMSRCMPRIGVTVSGAGSPNGRASGSAASLDAAAEEDAAAAEGAAAAGAALSAAAIAMYASISPFRTRPCGPVGSTRLRSMPCSFARRRTVGVVRIFASGSALRVLAAGSDCGGAAATAAGAAVAERTGAGAEAATGAGAASFAGESAFAARCCGTWSSGTSIMKSGAPTCAMPPTG